MKIFAYILSFLLMATPAWALKKSEQDMVSEGKETGLKWLEMVDNKEYKKTWELTGKGFKKLIPEAKWVDLMQTVREPFGPVDKRTIQKARYHHTLPGLPVGDYIVIKTETDFLNKDYAVETLTLTLQKGKWKPIGYFIN